jgi:hypothetical protein
VIRPQEINAAANRRELGHANPAPLRLCAAQWYSAVITWGAIERQTMVPHGE